MDRKSGKNNREKRERDHSSLMRESTSGTCARISSKSRMRGSDLADSDDCRPEWTVVVVVRVTDVGDGVDAVLATLRWLDERDDSIVVVVFR